MPFEKQQEEQEVNSLPEEEEQSSTDTHEGVSGEALQNQLVAAEAKIQEHWGRILRQQAEMDNLQRRIERDVSNAHKYGLEKFILELLPVVDTLERAVATHEDAVGAAAKTDSVALFDGLALTLKMFHAALEKFALEQVNPIDQPFNPELHQAVSTQVDCDVESGLVITVLQKGYLLSGRLVRPALVIVAK